MLTDARLADLAEQLAGVDGVLGVLLGGSRARGIHTDASDFDVGIYYRSPLDIDRLRLLAMELAGPDADVTEPGEWGPWVDGGGWLSIDGSAVDWLYRDLHRVRTSWRDAQAGRLNLHVQVGHPFGVPDFWYAGEIALGVLLADPTGELSALQAQARRYPDALGIALVDRLWEARFYVQSADKAVGKADTAYVAGCLFRAVLVCAHALCGHGRTWVVNEKGAVHVAGQLPAAPDGFENRRQSLLGHLGTTTANLHQAVAMTGQLVTEVEEACRTPVSE